MALADLVKDIKQHIKETRLFPYDENCNPYDYGFGEDFDEDDWWKK
ncbi:MAG: hypothetical protein IT258_19280 [Saprospiraceae bacterium]|nr:hypothetical protein [Saprospiraceae bacterium]